jgi:hypothetical protein
MALNYVDVAIHFALTVIVVAVAVAADLHADDVEREDIVDEMCTF